MPATEVTDCFLEGRKTLVSRVEKSKTMQIHVNLHAYFSSVGQHSSPYVGKIFQQFYFGFWSCRLNHKSSLIDREYDQECLKAVCRSNAGHFK